MKIFTEIADITTLKVDAIVNAANNALVPGGGVDGAIHKAAGPQLFEATTTLHGFGCNTGQAVVTEGFNLPAKYVIHTVGPDMRQYGQELGDALLRSCYHQCMKLAVDEGLTSIAFPAISTGIFGFDPKRAADIAISVVLGWKDTTDVELEVYFACFDQASYDIIHGAVVNDDDERHYLNWSIGEYPEDDDWSDFIEDLNTDALDGVHVVTHEYLGTDGSAHGVTVKDGKFVLEPTLRACAEARNDSGYHGTFLVGLTWDEKSGTFTAAIDS